MNAHSRQVRVLFRVAAGPRVGFGHLVRAVSLANALGVQPVVSVRGSRGSEETARRLGARVLKPGPPLQVLLEARPGVLVVDDRVANATRAWRRAARTIGIPIVSIHDLGLGLGDADLFVDGSLGAESRWASESVGRQSVPALLGPRYAILNHRCVTAAGSPRAHTASDVLIALGGGPRSRAPRRLASAILRRRPDVRVSVAGGFVAPQRRVDTPRIHWVTPAALCTCLASATVAIVGGGVTLYETAAIGVPTVAVAVVLSQRPTVRAFAAAGATIDGGELPGPAASRGVVNGIAERVLCLLDDAEKQRRLSRTARTLIDGGGASRVATAIHQLVVSRSSANSSILENRECVSRKAASR